MKYEMRRDAKQQARSVETDDTNGVVYCYVRFTDRVDVHKFSKADLQATQESGDELLARSQPAYRVQGGQCTCEGYKYRDDCRHVDRVRRLAESVRNEGWEGAGK